MKYTVYLNYGYDDETVLYESDNLEQAIAWADDHTDSEIGPGDMMEVAWFNSDDEFVSEWIMSYEDMD